MAGYSLNIRTKVAFQEDAVKFLKFLQNVGRKHDLKLHYRSQKRGRFSLQLDGTPGIVINEFFQELILNRGLYYYKCSLVGVKTDRVVANVIIPIFQTLLEYFFEYPRTRHVRSHIFGKSLVEKYIPSDFQNSFSHEFEILFRRWSSKLLDDFGFIKDLDSFLTRFMLVNLGHVPGTPSPKFHILISNVYVKGVGMELEDKKIFNSIHVARTYGLHRLTEVMTRKELTTIAFRLYNYFQYFNDFSLAQKVLTHKLHGKRFKRIKYGDEVWLDKDGKPFRGDDGIPWDGRKMAERPCHDCMAIIGQYHCDGCDWELCPRCNGQFLGCSCRLLKDFE